jgi:hypothetical protein
MLLSGCVLPAPHVRGVSPVLCGRLVDQANSQPLSGVSVCVFGFPKTASRSDSNGNFRVGPASRFKWGYLWTPALVHDFPAGECFEHELRIQIRDPLFELVSSLGNTRSEHDSVPSGTVDLGTIALRSKMVRQGSTGKDMH